MAVYLRIKIAFQHFSKRISKIKERMKEIKIRILPTSEVTFVCWCILFFHKFLKIFSPQYQRPSSRLQAFKYEFSKQQFGVYTLAWKSFAFSFKRTERKIIKADGESTSHLLSHQYGFHLLVCNRLSVYVKHVSIVGLTNCNPLLSSNFTFLLYESFAAFFPSTRKNIFQRFSILTFSFFL